MTDFRCEACNGTGLATIAAQKRDEDERQRSYADMADTRWRQAAEAVLQAVRVQDEPALAYIQKLVDMGEGFDSQRGSSDSNA